MIRIDASIADSLCWIPHGICFSRYSTYLEDRISADIRATDSLLARFKNQVQYRSHESISLSLWTSTTTKRSWAFLLRSHRGYRGSQE